MTPGEVTARWAELARLSDLRTSKRLATKVPMGAEAVSRRWRQVETLRRACLAFARLGAAPDAKGLTAARRPSAPLP